MGKKYPPYWREVWQTETNENMEGGSPKTAECSPLQGTAMVFYGTARCFNKAR